MQNQSDPDIVLERGPCMLVNKPGGLLTQGPPGVDSLEQRIRRYMLRRDSHTTDNLYLGVPHRLDRPVSGAMVFATTLQASQILASQFQQRTVVKKYWAIVEGEMDDDAGIWIDWMRKIPDQAKAEIVARRQPTAQEARLRFFVIERQDDKTWLEIHLETGRMHQIRLQCSHHRHPVVGDFLYGAQTKFGPQTDDLRCRWIALHSRYLEFEHPVERTACRVECPASEYWNVLGFSFPV
jgi:23S rRNA pseudouridine1911/1915/1917 synthase